MATSSHMKDLHDRGLDIHALLACCFRMHESGMRPNTGYPFLDEDISIAYAWYERASPEGGSNVIEPSKEEVEAILRVATFMIFNALPSVTKAMREAYKTNKKLRDEGKEGTPRENSGLTDLLHYGSRQVDVADDIEFYLTGTVRESELKTPHFRHKSKHPSYHVVSDDEKRLDFLD